jgi:hypothetical protein
MGLVLRHGPEIPYGPFLCLAALAVVVGWSPLWQWSEPIFGLGGLLILVILFCLIAVVPLLVLMRVIRLAAHWVIDRAPGQ